VGGRRASDISEELAGLKANSPGVPLSRLIDTRQELTALIKAELYGGGDKMEGRAALMARRGLDEFFFHTEQSQLTRGNVADLDVLKGAIILETLAEQVDLLDQARDAGDGSQKGIQAEMLKLMDDPDRFDRFNDKDIWYANPRYEQAANNPSVKAAKQAYDEALAKARAEADAPTNAN
jgi:hypothetical protein